MSFVDYVAIVKKKKDTMKDAQMLDAELRRVRHEVYDKMVAALAKLPEYDDYARMIAMSEYDEGTHVQIRIENPHYNPNKWRAGSKQVVK